MHYLVTIDADFPSDLDSGTLDDVRSRERQRGRELVAQGTIERIWRVAGTTGNVGVWVAEDEAQLSHILETLPIHPWARYAITPLEQHPLEKEPTS